MTRKEYILYLSSNTLPKSVIDSKITAPVQPLYITPYEQAVLNGFKWSEKVFDIKFWIDTKLDQTSKDIQSQIKDNIDNLNKTIESKIQTADDNIKHIKDDLWAYRELVNKRINDTNDKITKKNETILWEVKEILPKVENIVETKAKTIIKTIETVKQDIEWQINAVDENIQDINSTIDIAQKSIKKKANTSHKHDTSDINTLDEVIVSINKSIDTRATFDEVQTALSSFYTKEETYNKKEVDSIVDEYKKKKGTSIIWRLSPWGTSYTNPMTTLWDIMYGATTGTQTRLWGNTTTTKKYLQSTWSWWLATAPTRTTIDGTLVHTTTNSTTEIGTYTPPSMTWTNNTILWWWSSWWAITTWYNNTIYWSTAGTALTTWHDNLILWYGNTMGATSTYSSMIWAALSMWSVASITLVWSWNGNSWIVWNSSTVLWSDNCTYNTDLYWSIVIWTLSGNKEISNSFIIWNSIASTAWWSLNSCTSIGDYSLQETTWVLTYIITIWSYNCNYLDWSTSNNSTAIWSFIFRESATVTNSFWFWTYVFGWTWSAISSSIWMWYDNFNQSNSSVTNTISFWNEMGSADSIVTDCLIFSSRFWYSALINAGSSVIIWLNSWEYTKEIYSSILLGNGCDPKDQIWSNVFCVWWWLYPIYDIYLWWWWLKSAYPSAETLTIQPTQSDTTSGATMILRWWLYDVWNGASLKIQTSINTTYYDSIEFDYNGNIATARLHNNASTKWTNQIRSWTYTPTLYNTTNIAASSVTLCRRMQVWSVVHVAWRVSIDLTATGAYTLGMTIPVASALANAYELSGTDIWEWTAGDTWYIEADATNDRASFKWTGTNVAAHYHHFTFTYEVL